MAPCCQSATRTMLITPRCFSCWWTRLEQHQGLLCKALSPSVNRLGVCKRLAGGTARQVTQRVVPCYLASWSALRWERNRGQGGWPSFAQHLAGHQSTWRWWVTCSTLLSFSLLPLLFRLLSSFYLDPQVFLLLLFFSSSPVLWQWAAAYHCKDLRLKVVMWNNINQFNQAAPEVEVKWSKAAGQLAWCIPGKTRAWSSQRWHLTKNSMVWQGTYLVGRPAYRNKMARACTRAPFFCIRLSLIQRPPFRRDICKRWAEEGYFLKPACECGHMCNYLHQPLIIAS